MEPTNPPLVGGPMSEHVSKASNFIGGCLMDSYPCAIMTKDTNALLKYSSVSITNGSSLLRPS